MVFTMAKIYVCDYSLVTPCVVAAAATRAASFDILVMARDVDEDRFEVVLMPWCEDIEPNTAQWLAVYKAIKPYLYRA